MDEIMLGVTWALSNVAERIGQPTLVESIRALPTMSWPGAPPLLIYYSYDNNNVTLLAVQRVDDDDDEG
jgi:hypothetical protein